MTFTPAAADTIERFLRQTKTNPSDYDLILTGDLGSIGSQLLCQILFHKGLDISSVHEDCGNLLFDAKKQDVHAGGSGCGCSAALVSTISNQSRCTDPGKSPIHQRESLTLRVSFWFICV